MEKSISMVAMIAIAVSLAGIANAYAQPIQRAITLGMPFTAGGPGDTLARILAEPRWWPILRAANIKGEWHDADRKCDCCRFAGRWADADVRWRIGIR
jgi:hypothetical protein